MPTCPSIVVSFNAPHRISTFHCSKDGFLGFSKELLRNRTIQIFHGPKTSAAQLSNAINKSAENKPMIAEFHLYDVTGECRAVMLRISAFRGTGGSPVACMISIDSDLKKYFADNEIPQVAAVAIDKRKNQCSDLLWKKKLILSGWKHCWLKICSSERINESCNENSPAWVWLLLALNEMHATHSKSYLSSQQYKLWRAAYDTWRIITGFRRLNLG